MYDAGALVFKLQTLGAQLFQKDQSDAKVAVEKTGQAAQASAGQVDKLGTSTDTAGKKAKAAKGPLDEQATSTKKVGDENQSADPKIKKTTASTEQQIEAAKKLAAVMAIAGTAIAAMVTLAVVKHTEFDAAMSNVRAATMSTAEEQERLGAAALEAGADTAYSAREAAQAEEELAKAGLSVSEIVGGSLNGALALAAAGQLQVARSAEIMATTLTQFRLPAEQAAHVSDVLAAGAGKAQGSVDDLALALSYVGPLANQAGWSLEETTGTLAYFAKQGILGEKAGTSLRGVLAALQSPSAIAAKTMQQYGLSIYDANGEMLSASGVAGQMQKAFSGLTAEERNAALGRIFGNESLLAATLLYQGGADAISGMTNEVNDYGFATEQAAMRQDNLAGDIEKLGGAFDTALIKTGSGANDVLREMVQAVTALVDWYGEWPAPLQAAALVTGVAAAATLLLAGGAVAAKAKFLELKLAMDQANVSMGRTALVGGLAGLALTGVLLAVGLVMNAQAQAKQRAEAYADAIESGADRSSKAFADLADEALAANRTFLGIDLGGDSAYKSAEKLGISLGTVRDAALGSAPALRELQQIQEDIANSDTQSLMDKYGFTVAEATMAEANINTVIDAVKGNNATVEEAIGIADRKKQAEEESVEASQTAADAYLEQSESVEDLNSQLTELIDSINAANGMNQDAITANIDYQDTLREVETQIANITGGVEGFGRGLDETTEAGTANKAMLVDLAKDSWDAAAAQLQLDGNTAGFTQRLETSRQKLYESAIAMGATDAEATALRDSILAIPDQKTINMLAETTAAQQQIDSYISRNTGRQIIVRIGTSQVAQGLGGAGGITQADGGVVSYHANGSVSEHHVAQIARAGEWRVWAEPETGGEGYVPLAASKRARSEQIMSEIADRFGGRYIPAGAQQFADGSRTPAVSETQNHGIRDGDRVTFIIEGTPLTAVARKVADSRGAQVSADIRNRRWPDA